SRSSVVHMTMREADADPPLHTSYIPRPRRRSVRLNRHTTAPRAAIGYHSAPEGHPRGLRQADPPLIPEERMGCDSVGCWRSNQTAGEEGSRAGPPAVAQTAHRRVDTDSADAFLPHVKGIYARHAPTLRGVR